MFFHAVRNPYCRPGMNVSVALRAERREDLESNVRKRKSKIQKIEESIEKRVRKKQPRKSNGKPRKWNKQNAGARN